ncbi:tyrosinase family protein [Pseudomonas sp. KFB-139]|uniref:Tyrosinase family protein n=1 Tax=Pseudomonas serbiensis TaxID=3064350 RepID=A0ABT9CR60_9PSED|nr:tyrosinase family protein [Pseudomonas sp. KFB-138]MDO7927990.1 tyrosinase family protein [Pseudomonas sp. KFB-138]
MTIRRRTLLKLSALAGGAMILPDVMQRALAASNTTKTRYSASTPQGKLMLAIYARAVALMMKKPDTDPLSWKFQWYTHATPIPKQTALQQVFGSTTGPHRQMAEAMWYTCEPHASNNSDAFLPWHRMYVMYLEQIVRDVSGDQSFTLPYWDYVGSSCTPAGQCSVIPEEFRQPNHPLWGSLYRPNRNPGINGGTPIDPSLLSLDSMKSPRYRESGSDVGFCENLDMGLHGTIHVQVGDNTNMGRIPTAANDPIFWLHHCNIDRVWASWNKAGGLNPQDTAFTSQSWTFSNGQGAPVISKVGDVLDTTTLTAPYVYDSYLSRPAGSVPFNKPLVKAASVHALSLSKLESGKAKAQAVALGEKPVRVALASQLNTTAKGGFGNKLFSAVQSDTLYLTLSDISASEEGANDYAVYLNLPEGVTPTPEDPSFVGVISFFNLGMTIHGGHHTMTRNISFVVTDVVQKLTDAKRMNQAPTVTFAPIGKNNVNAKPVVGSISLQSS